MIAAAAIPHDNATATEASTTTQALRLREWSNNLPHALPHTVTASKASTSNEVIRLRQWGTDRVYMLPGPPFHDCYIDTPKAYPPQPPDLHASSGPRLTYRHQQWWVQHFGSKVDLRQDGIPREEFVLDPGVEIGVGPTTLIAESLRSSAVRRRPLARDRRRR